MEYIPHGPLRRFIPKNDGLPIEIVRAYGAQLVVFLEYLHSELEVCHRDLKPGNIMIDDNLYLKIVSIKIYFKGVWKECLSEYMKFELLTNVCVLSHLVLD